MAKELGGEPLELKARDGLTSSVPFFNQQLSLIEIKMKKPNIQKRYRAYNPMKGFNYANRQSRNMFMATFAIFGIFMLVAALLDHSLGAAAGPGRWRR